MVNSVHMVFTCCSHAVHRACLSSMGFSFLCYLPFGSLNHRSFPFLNDLHKSYTKCHTDNDIFNTICSGLSSLRVQVAGYMQLVGGELNSPGRSPFGLIFLLFPTKKPRIMLIVAGGNHWPLALCDSGTLCFWRVLRLSANVLAANKCMRWL